MACAPAIHATIDDQGSFDTCTRFGLCKGATEGKTNVNMIEINGDNKFYPLFEFMLIYIWKTLST